MSENDYLSIWKNRADGMIPERVAQTFLNLEQGENTKHIVHVHLSALFKRATDKNLLEDKNVVKLLEEFESAGYKIRVIPLGRHLTQKNPARAWLKEKNWNYRENNSGLFDELEKRVKGDKLLAAFAIVDLTRINNEELRSALQRAHVTLLSPKNIIQPS